MTIPVGADDSAIRLTIGPGQAMPAFALADAAGDIVRLKSFKQRRPVLVALLHGSSCPQCRDWLATVAHVQGELADLQVQPLLVVPDDVEQLPALQADTGAPGVFLSDPAGETRAGFYPATHHRCARLSCSLPSTNTAPVWRRGWPTNRAICRRWPKCWQPSPSPSKKTAPVACPRGRTSTTASDTLCGALLGQIFDGHEGLTPPTPQALWSS